MFKQKKPEQLLMFPDFEARKQKKEGENQNAEERKEKAGAEPEPKKEKTQPLDVESWNFDVLEGGAERDGSEKESTVLFQKEKGWSVVDSKGEEKEISWVGAKMLLAKNYDQLLKTDEEFQKLAEHFESR